MKRLYLLLLVGCLVVSQGFSQSSSQDVIKDQAVTRTLGEMQHAADSKSGVGLIGTFSTKEETVGSELLFPDSRSGSVTGKDGIVYSFPSLNYDKITGDVWVFADDKQVTALDRFKVSAFRFDSPGESTIMFRCIDLITPRVYLKVLIADSAYSLYDKLQTIFIHANYTSDGLTESGQKFDEFSDRHAYYIGAPGGKRFVSVTLTRRSLTNSFRQNNNALLFLRQHKDEPVTEAFLKGFVSAMNDK